MIAKKILCVLVLYSNILFAQTDKKTIYLELKFEVTPYSKLLPDSINIQYAPYPWKLWYTWIREKRKTNNATWMIHSDKPIILDVIDVATLNSYNRWLLEPSDSIVVLVRNGTLYFSGRGADKLNMNNELRILKEYMPKPSNPSVYSVFSVEDYLEWDNSLNRRMALSETIVESYKDLVSPLAQFHAKAETIIDIEEDRWEKFRRLALRKYFNISSHELTTLYDEHFLSTSTKWVWEQDITYVSRLPLVGRHLRAYNFVDSAEILRSNVDRQLSLWEFAKNEFRGEALENFLARFLTYNIISKIGFVSRVDSTLKKYYADKNRDPQYQSYVREFERKTRVLKAKRTIPSFCVYENKWKLYTKSDLKGKVIILHFIKPGSKGGQLTIKDLKRVYQTFGNNPYVKLLQLPINLQPDSIIQKFNITDYPAVFVMDINGRLVTSSFIDSSLDGGKIYGIIREQAEIAKREAWQGHMDGPYVISRGKATNSYQIKEGKLITLNGSAKSFAVATDQPGKTFNITLKDYYKTEPSIFSQPEKLLAFSDIEGEFESLRLLLQKNNVIDDQFNWRFGKGHIVFAGDMFDRGEQVTECLWLMYSLEEKAKAAGGYVHFILGNHEMMNLNGNHRYTRAKYLENAQRIDKSLVDLYGENSELGKWLRSKNIVEKIGDILFAHAGISKAVNDLYLTVEQINDLARPWYDNSAGAKSSGDKRLALLYDDKLSPFWYRDYYLELQAKPAIGNNKNYVFYKTPEVVIDSVLKQYGANKIVTGHTVWEGVHDIDRGKWLSVHYGGKVINLDTYHKYGYSEALLIKGSKYVAVNKSGEERDLFNNSVQNSQVVSK